MTQPPPPPSPPDDGELLSAYLADELDDAASAALERRLTREPALRAAIEQQRELQERLAAAIAPAAPAGAGERLRGRLAAARAEAAREGAGTAAAAATPGPPAPDGVAADRGTPASLDAARDRRRRRAARWPALGSVAAALVAVAVISVGVLDPAGDRAGDDAGMAAEGERQLAEAPAGDTGDTAPREEAAEDDADAATGPAGEEGAAAMQAPTAGEGTESAGAPGVAEQGQPAEEAADAAAPDAADAPERSALLQPVVVDAGVVLAGAEAAAAHLAGLPEVKAVLGTEPEDAARLAEAFTTALREHEALPDGTLPGICLDALGEGVDGPVVPVRVEALTYQGAPALAYVFATASRPGGPLDAAHARLLAPTPACTPLLDVPLEGPTE